MAERNSGILMHITSLPGKEGIGTLGNEAYDFIDFLHESGQEIWQILPLGPAGSGNSPYQCYSAFAGNPLIIDLQKLIEGGFLDKKDLNSHPSFPTEKVNFNKVSKWKYHVLRKAFERFKTGNNDDISNEYGNFLKEHIWWLGDYALFMAARKHFNYTHWSGWNSDFKFRNEQALRRYSEMLSEEIEFHKFLQFLFFRQWFRLKNYAQSKNVMIFGDMPIYVAGDSADIWSNTDIFFLDENLEPTIVGGVPPDYFSETGQLWGNPVFNWERLEKRDFDWWLARLHFNIHLFHKVRIDHFRGLESFWAVPANEKNAVNGEWLPAKGFQLLEKFRSQIGNMPLVAEDLGVITDEVRNLRDNFNLPGMKVLQFAFTSDPSNEHLPHNYKTGFIAYTGTHDNNTTLGWLKSAKGKERRMAAGYLGKLGKKALIKGIEWVWSSPAKSVIMPMQDLLRLDTRARFNVPGTAEGNWEWRFVKKQLKLRHKKFLTDITQKYNR